MSMIEGGAAQLPGIHQLAGQRASVGPLSAELGEMQRVIRPPAAL
jgi:hypothetical protein